MRTVTSEQMRELDRRTIEEYGTPGEILMERAGIGVADHVERLIRFRGLVRPRVRCVAGRGNNGGDASVVAIQLHRRGIDVDLLLAGSAADVKGDARTYLDRARADGITLHELPNEADWSRLSPFPRPDMVVDGVLGTGTSGAPRGTIQKAIQYINGQAGRALVVSIDIPSGLNADTGAPEEPTVRADWTVTMGLPKRGFTALPALEYIGAVDVVDIGIPAAYVDALPVDTADLLLIDRADAAAWMPRRDRDAHKGRFGHVLLIGGARGYSGAIVLAVRAALRSGAGLVSALVPDEIASLVAGAVPEAMIHQAPATDDGSLSVELWGDWRARLKQFDAILAGPGMTRHADTLLLMRQLIRDCPVPLILDADAISVFANQPHWMEKADCPLILTPHPGELGLLLGKNVKEIQGDRAGAALATAEQTQSITILKGAGTVVAQAGQPVHLNLTGNPGMATGGSGDVLAGLLTGLAGQKVEPFDAARLAVYLHGKAGDIAAWKSTQASLNAGDIVDSITDAFRAISAR